MRASVALLEGTRPGLTERELGNLVERAYVGDGGTTFIHYIGVTSMAKPHIFVPPQYPSARKVQKGDVVFCELSASWWDYPGQVLRTFTVGADPTPLYRDLHETAEAAFDAVTRVVRHGTTMQEIRCRERHRGARLHGVRRPDARLRRRLLPADPGHRAGPPGRCRR